MKEGLEILYQLQKKDNQIREIETTIKEIPAEIEKLETERDGKVTIIETSKQKLQDNVKAREKLEKEILLVKEKINKYKEQMNKSTTNKEYQGFISEIKYEEEQIGVIEEKIIEKMVQSDEIMGEIRESEEAFNSIADEYNKKIEDFKTTMAYNKTRLMEEKKNKDEIREQVAKNMLKLYDNLFAKKAGKAVSFVESDFCGVCNVKIRPQMLNELITTNDLFICENCGRILYKKMEILEEDEPKKRSKKN